MIDFAMRFIVNNQRIFDPFLAKVAFAETEADGCNGRPIGVYTKAAHLRTQLYLTNDGEWFIIQYSQINSSTISAKLITEDHAKLWLVVNGLDDEFRKIFRESPDYLLRKPIEGGKGSRRNR